MAHLTRLVGRSRNLALILPIVTVVAMAPAGATSVAASSERHGPTLTAQSSGTINRLQAISPVNTRVVWASGLGGTYAVTTNGGKTWRAAVVPSAAGLQFRDVQGVSDRVAYLLSSGVGTDSRIYKTTDGGATWTMQFQNQDPNGFYDCFAFWTPTRGLTFADSVNGRFPVVRTTNGKTWQDIGDRLPAAQDGEGGFAASGTCVATQGEKRAWIGTGAATKARVLATTDGGNTWQAYDTPIVQGTSTSGVISIAFRDGRHGILGGGELLAPTVFSNNVARSSDGGKHWQLASGTSFPGAVYGLSYAGESRTVVATGPSGSAWTPNEGTTWVTLPGLSGYWAVAFANENVGWLVGTGGRIEKISFGGDGD